MCVVYKYKCYMFCLVITPQQSPGQCLDGWQHWRHGCYLYQTTADVYSHNHDEAYEYCHRFGPAVHLLAIETKEEQEFITKDFLFEKGKWKDFSMNITVNDIIMLEFFGGATYCFSPVFFL